MAAGTKRLETFKEIKAVMASPPVKGQRHHPIAGAGGLYLTIQASGSASWNYRFRCPETQKQQKLTIGRFRDGKGDSEALPPLGAPHALAEAKRAAEVAAGMVARGENPAAAKRVAKATPKEAQLTFRKMAERFIERHVKKKGLRSASEIERQLKIYVYPEWENEPFVDVRRGRVVTLLDKIDDGEAGVDGTLGGPVMADRVLATLRKLFNWAEVRDENYTSPIVRGMRENSAKERDRKLFDPEIRLLWADWEGAGTFGAFLQICLLTAQRRAKVLSMKWADVSDAGVWTIPVESREKVNAGTLKLPKKAHDIIKARPKVKGNPYVFAGGGKVPISNLGRDKAALDKRVPTDPPWRVHDLRHTAKSLMARAGVRPDISERTLGHVISGVEGTYDQHDYVDEKADALAKLAALIEMILNPPADNVVRFGAGEEVTA